MNDQELSDFIKKQLENKVKPEKIKLALLSSGWLEEKVNEAMMAQGIELPPIEDTNSSKRKVEITKPFNKKFMFGLIIVVLVLLSGGVYAYFNYFLAPERILFKSFQKMNDVETMQYVGQINFESTDKNLFGAVNKDGILPIDMSSITGKNTKFSMYLAAASDVSDIYNPKFTVKLASLPSGEEMVSDLGAEIRFFGKDKVYASLSDMPAEFFGGLDLSILENKWIEFDLKDFIKTETIIQDNSKKDVPKPPEMMFKLEKVKEKLPGLVKYTQKIGVAKVNDIDVYQYRILFDTEKIAQLYFDLFTENKNLSELQMKNLREKIATLDAVEGDVFIGQKDLLMHKVNLIVGQKNNAGKIEISLQIKEHNEPVTIEMPAEAKTLKELMSDILMSVLSGGKTEPETSLEATAQNAIDSLDILTSTSTFSDAEVNISLDSDGDLLNDIDEQTLWGTDPNNPDTDGDGFSDGDEVKNGFNPNGAGNLPTP